jgi:hypothetical protein
VLLTVSQLPGNVAGPGTRIWRHSPVFGCTTVNDDAGVANIKSAPDAAIIVATFLRIWNLLVYGVYSSALATGSLPHPLGLQFASLAPPALRTCPLVSRARAAPPTRPWNLGPVAVHVPVAGE